MKIGSYFTSNLPFTIIFLFLIPYISLKAQESDDVWYNVVSVPPSPNAAALGKYGEIPVDKSTGVPNISIPILDLNYGGIDIPISLSYHAGGIRVQDEATWVGLGWSLNAGGVITRTMRGLPDDHSYGFLQTAEKVPWAHIIDKELSTPELAELTYERINEIAKGYIDYEPDIFYYNIGNLSGSFIFSNNRQPITVPFSDIKIIPVYHEYRICGFILVNTDGIIYKFGDLQALGYTEKTNVTVKGPDPEDYISSWYIQEIYNPLKQSSVSFDYDSFVITNSINYSETKTYERNVFGNYELISNDPPNQCITYINNAKYLRRILFGFGNYYTYDDSIVFHSSSSNDGGRKLDFLRFKGQKFEFYYDYFKVDEDSNDKNELRLKLLSVKETNPEIEYDKEYTFEYSSVNLPPKNAKGIDYWGFYNGKNNNPGTIPYLEYAGQTLGNADRSPNPAYSKAVILTRITYPTGGYSEFAYDNNAYGGFPTTEEISSDIEPTYVYVTGEDIQTENCQFESLIFDTAFEYINFVLHGDLSVDSNFVGTPHGRIQLIGDNAAPPDNILYETELSGTSHYEIDLGSVDLESLIGINVCAEGGLTHALGWLEYQRYDPNELTIKREYPAGGLRIEQISNYDHVSKKITYKTYDYNKSGYLNVEIPDYFITCKDRRVVEGQIQDFDRLMIYSNPVGGLGNSANSVSYEKVTEYSGTKQYNTGKITTTLLHYKDNPVGGTPFIPQLSYQFMRSKVTCEEYYKYNSESSYDLVKKIDYQYEPDTDHIFMVRGFKASRIMTVGSGYHYSDWYDEEFNYLNFYLPTYNNRIKSVLTCDYSDLGNFVSTTKEYYYANPEHLNPTLTISNLSDGKKFKTVYKYPSDYLPFSNDCKFDYEAILDSCKNFYNEWSTELNECLSIYGEAYEILLYCDSISYVCYNREWGFFDAGHVGKAFGYPFSKCKHYENCHDDFEDNLINLGYYDCLDTNNYIACQVNANIQYSNCLTNYYNSISELYESTTDPFYKGVYLLAANNFDNTLIEKVEYIEDQEVAHYKFNYTEFDTTHLPILVKAERELNNEGFTTEMLYNNYDDHLNISQITQFGLGSPSSYIWGYRQLYPVIVGQNVTLTDLSTALDATTGNLDSLLYDVGNLITSQQKDVWKHFNSYLRNHSLLRNSLITTYTFNPLIGQTSQTDPKGISTFYEYDNLGRLSIIRDNESKIIEQYTYNYQNAHVEVNPIKQDFPYTGGYSSAQITANSQWVIEENINWINIDKQTGVYNENVAISCISNPDTASRSGEISVVCGNALATISIYQNGTPYIIVDPDTVFFGADTDAIKVQVTSNIGWSAGVVERESWLEVNEITSKNFLIKCNQNDTGDDREGSIWVAGEGILLHIYVKQWHI